MKYIKRIIFWGIIAAIAYALLGYHYIIINNSVKFLKKSRYTLDYTIFSTHLKTNKAILAIDDLREDGIGEILLDEGEITEMELERWLDFYQEEDKDS